MSLRDNILTRIGKNKPELAPLPVIDKKLVIGYDDPLSKLMSVLESIGATAIVTDSLDGLKQNIREINAQGKLVINTVAELREVELGLERVPKRNIGWSRYCCYKR